jgi:hypothetical protein
MREIATLSVFWFIAGYVSAVLINQFTDLSINPIQAGVLLLLVGLLWLAVVTRDERQRREFYEGPLEGEDGSFIIGCLWVTPFVILAVAIVVWWFLFVVTL